MLNIETLVLFISLISIVFSWFLAKNVFSYATGDLKMNEISSAIAEGASAYLNRQYSTIALVSLFLGIILYLSLGLLPTIGFYLGAILSAISGYLGMHIATKANVRTTQAATLGLYNAFKVAFRAGTTIGLGVVGIALLGLIGYYIILLKLNITHKVLLESLLSLSFGASLISMFARLGGGIFTKGADVGADLVGKIEAGIPEDDPRNPAVIADNVGDNVGDCAGMAADLFETYIVTMVATQILGNILAPQYLRHKLMLLPVAIGAACILGTIIGCLFVRLTKQNIMAALYKAFFTTSIISIVCMLPVFNSILGLNETIKIANISVSGYNLFFCSVIGIALTGILVWITEYYTSTSFRPVRSIAQASLTGHATNVIQGLAISMESTALPAIAISIAILLSYYLANLYGIAIAATSMLALAGVVIALDAYGPITDNAGGIAEMAGLDKNVRNVTDALDAVGNTTKAITKGYAIGSAGLAALVLFASYVADIDYYFPRIFVEFKLEDPFVVVGLLIGAAIPYLFCSFCMRSVGKAGAIIVNEVRRQFKEIVGLMQGKAKPEYGVAIDLLTKAAIKEMIIPSLLPVISPILFFILIHKFFNLQAALTMLGAMLLGSIISGLFLAISMTSGGGAWDNAKKFIEEGNFGGKKSEAHKAAVTGDTVGDPYKDTAGPAINPLVKIINIIALLLLATVAKL